MYKHVARVEEITMLMVVQHSIMESWALPYNYEIDVIRRAVIRPPYNLSLRGAVIRRAAFICNRCTCCKLQQGLAPSLQPVESFQAGQTTILNSKANFSNWKEPSI